MKGFPRTNADRVILSGALYNRLAESVEWLCNLTVAQPLQLSESGAGRVISIQPSPPQAVLVKITSTATGGGFYNGRILRFASTATGMSDLDLPEGQILSDSDDALLINPVENSSSGHVLQAGIYRVGTPIGFTKDSPPKTIVALAIHDAGLFPVSVSNSGGANGTSGSTASYIYDVYSLDGNLLGTDLSPAWARPMGAVYVAGNGIAYWAADGALVLYQVDEVPVMDSCG